MMQARKNRHILGKFVLGLIVISVILELLLWYYANPLIRGSVRKLVVRATDSLYDVSFDKIRVNLLTRSMYLTDFKLIPDTSRRDDKNLYSIEFDRFDLERFGMLSFVFKKQLYFKTVSFSRPKVYFYSVAKKQVDTTLPAGYSLVKQDFLANFFKLINSIYIYQIRIENGEFGFLKELRNAFNAKEVTLILRKFYVDKNTIDNKDLFTKDFVIEIRDYSVGLANNHRVKADLLEVFSAEKKIIFKHTRLYPEHLTDTANAFDIYADLIVLDGADFSDIYLNRNVDLQKAYFNGLDIKFYAFIRDRAKKQKKIKTPYEIYRLIKDKLNFIRVNEIEISDATFRQYDRDLTAPVTSIGRLDLRLDDLLVDSTAAFDTTRFFFAKDVFLDIRKYGMRLNDSLHAVSAKKMVIDTRTKLLQAEGFRLFPLFGGKLRVGKSLNNIQVPELKVTGFDLSRFYNTRVLSLNSVILVGPAMDIKAFRAKKRNKRIGLQQLMTGLVKRVRADTILIKNANYRFDRRLDGKQLKTSGIMDLHLLGFMVNPVAADLKHAIDFDATVLMFRDLVYYNSESIHLLKADTLFLNTVENKFVIKGVKLSPTGNADSLMRERHKSVKFDFSLPVLYVTDFDVKRYLTEDKLVFGQLKIDRPRMTIYSYPELSQKEIKNSLRDQIRKKAAEEIVLAASDAIFRIYQSVRQIDSATYAMLKHKQFAIDSLQNYAVGLIFNVHIPAAQINPEDTTSKITRRIYRVFMSSVRSLEREDLSLAAIDSVFYEGLSALNYIKQLTERPVMNFDEIGRSISDIVNEIKSDSIVLNNAGLKYVQVYDDKSLVLFDNMMFLSMYDFDFRADSTGLCQKNILCSKSVKFEIKNYHYYFSDSVHQAVVEDLILNTADSSALLKNIVIFADSSRKNVNTLIAATIPGIELRGVDYWRLIDSNVLNVSLISSGRSFVHLFLNQKTEKSGIKPQSVLLLPPMMHKISIDSIDLGNILLRVDKPASQIKFSSVLSFKVSDFDADSVLDLSGYVLPVKYWTFGAEKVRFSSPSLGLEAKSFKIDNRGFAELNDLQAEADSNVFAFRRLSLTEFDLISVLKHQEFSAVGIYLDRPLVSLKGKGQKTDSRDTSGFELRRFDLYSKISKYLCGVYFDTLQVNDLRAFRGNDSLRHLYLKVLGFALDSTVKLDSPKLFYSDNIMLTIKDFNRRLSRFYSAGFSRLSVDLAKRQIFVDSLRYYPNYPPREFMALQKWRTTLTDVFVGHLSVNRVDWDSMLFSRAFVAKSIFINGLELYAYLDKALPHNYNDRKPHLVELLMKARIPIVLQSVILRKGNIVYEEKLPENSKPGHIELNDLNMVLSNVTNRPDSNNPYLNMRMSSLLQEHGYLTVYGFFKLDTSLYPFKLYGMLGRMDLKVFNPYLIYAANIEVTSGKLRRAEFVINGEDSIATGYLKATYHNLGVNVLRPSEEFNPRPNKLLSFLADVVVRSDNPRYGIFYKVGTIAYIHDRSFSDIKFWVKAVVSGLKSLVLFENKRQMRQIRRIKRNQGIRGHNQQKVKAKGKMKRK